MYKQPPADLTSCAKIDVTNVDGSVRCAHSYCQRASVRRDLHAEFCNCRTAARMLCAPQFRRCYCAYVYDLVGAANCRWSIHLDTLHTAFWVLLFATVNVTNPVSLFELLLLILFLIATFSTDFFSRSNHARAWRARSV